MSQKGKDGNYRLSNTAEAIFERTYNKSTRRYVAPFLSKRIIRLTPEQHQLLLGNVFYYKCLSDKKQQLFGNRVLNFIQSINITGRQNYKVSDEMKILVAAMAVQLTFGWRNYYLRMFKRIFIFPTAYYNRFTKQYHKGETSPMGVVVLSWDSFKKGIEIVDDNLNLGIHEFAHALVLQRNKSEEFADPIFVKWVDKLSRNLDNPQLFKALSENEYFRPYAKANVMEFFAVATEAFFETPDSFKEELPKLYALFCKMYNQDPGQVYHRSNANF